MAENFVSTPSKSCSKLGEASTPASQSCSPAATVTRNRSPPLFSLSRLTTVHGMDLAARVWSEIRDLRKVPELERLRAQVVDATDLRDATAFVLARHAPSECPKAPEPCPRVHHELGRYRHLAATVTKLRLLNPHLHAESDLAHLVHALESVSSTVACGKEVARDGARGMLCHGCAEIQLGSFCIAVSTTAARLGGIDDFRSRTGIIGSSRIVTNGLTSDRKL